MANALDSSAGLNARGWRLKNRAQGREGAGVEGSKKNVVDGTYLTKFVNLPRHVQEELAAGIGTTAELVMDNLLEISCETMPM
jgi:hypothetical protein